MPHTPITAPDGHATSTSLCEKLLNIFATPGDVFAEVAAQPPRLANWLVPTLLVCLTSIILLHTERTVVPTTEAIYQMAKTGTDSVVEAEKLSGDWKIVPSLAICFGIFAATFWSAFVLWLIGRMFLKTRFSFLKTLEVVGLTGMILVLGSIVTRLSIVAFGDGIGWPVRNLLGSTSDPILKALQTINFFYLWSTLVLAVGLARLSNVSFKESAFWVFGYWIFIRIAIIMLA